MTKLALDKVTWGDVRERVMQLNPELAKIIDEISPDDRYYLYTATYPYGAEIGRKSKLYIPQHNSRKLIPIDSPDIPAQVKEDLMATANFNPLLMPIRRNIEVFTPLKNSVVSFGIVPAGAVLSGQRLLDISMGCAQNFPVDFYMTSGARSVISLPKLTNTNNMRKMSKHLGGRFSIPSSIQDYWKLFSQVSLFSDEPWDTELLFFPRRWCEKVISDDMSWVGFSHYLLKKNWLATCFWRKLFYWELELSKIIEDQALQLCPFVLSTVKHLLMISSKGMPGFSPLIDDSVAPVSFLQKAFLEGYEIRQQPILLGAYSNVYADTEAPQYYSLNFPTMINYFEKKNQRKSLLTDLIKVKDVLLRFLSALLVHKQEMEVSGSTSIHQVVAVTEFDFFHLDEIVEESIYSACTLYEDRGFKLAQKAHFTHLPLTERSAFFHGCVRIST